jgi:hypothetical protein
MYLTTAKNILYVAIAPIWTLNCDDFVKSPDTALRCILRRCGVRASTPHSSGFARLACGTFYEAVELKQF